MMETDGQGEQTTVSREDIESSDSWMRSIGKDLFAVHYRERDGTGHAVCPFFSDTCTIHYDKENAHTNPVSHLVKDAPEVVVAAAATAVLGPKGAKRILTLFR